MESLRHRLLMASSEGKLQRLGRMKCEGHRDKTAPLEFALPKVPRARTVLRWVLFVSWIPPSVGTGPTNTDSRGPCRFHVPRNVLSSMRHAKPGDVTKNGSEKAVIQVAANTRHAHSQNADLGPS